MRARNVFFLLLGACVAGGLVGALANSAALWAAGTYGVTGALGVAVQPAFTWAWLRPRLLWGALWGAGFVPLAALGGRRPVTWALVYSLAPCAVQLFHVFPKLQGKGTLGVALGELTPAVVLAANAVYGLVLGLWLRLSVTER